MCVLFVFFIRSQIESLPQGIVVDFDIECGESTNDTANITFLTDVDYITPVALCNGTEVILTPIDDFRSTINASYPGGSDVGCIFLRTYGPGIDVYSVNIEVAHNVNGTLIQNADDVYSLTCSFGDEIDGHADARKMIHFPPKALTDIKSRNITTNLTLDVVDYGGVSLTGKLIPLGKNIRLKAEILATSNETSFRAFSCQAISYDGIETFDILIGGKKDNISNIQRLLQKGFTQGEIQTEAKENGNPLIIALTDAKSAFDVVWHDGLLREMNKVGLCGDNLFFLKDWYKGLNSNIKWLGQTSRTFLESQGVRQGGVWSPTAYKIFIKTPFSLHSKFIVSVLILVQYINANDINALKLIDTQEYALNTPNKKNLTSFVKFIVRNNEFQINEQLYKQNIGATIGGIFQQIAQIICLSYH
ncbi:Hypothetical predicted protein [Mytilus galloprovincialis]|nr:Hypothetical predicted protein [Mytilus galloprovincialis]